MTGRLLVIIIVLPMIVFLFITGYSYLQHTQIRSHINEVNYNTVDIITSSGVFNRNLYDYLDNEINRFSNNKYHIEMKLEKQIKPGVYETYFKEDEILDIPLSIGDKVTIYLEDRGRTTFERLLNTTFLNSAPDFIVDMNIKSVKSGVVANNPENVEIGYDVIANIEKYADDSYTAIAVQTKLASDTRYYGDSSHPSLSEVNAPTNKIYGDDIEEEGNIDTGSKAGEHFIFGNGVFRVREEHEGDYKLITYIQQ